MAKLNKSDFTSKYITNKSNPPSLQDQLDSTPVLGGYREITVTTAGDNSHTLTESDAGVVNISAALAAGAVIKLPAATANLVGWHTKILFTGTMATNAFIQLPNGGTGNFVGVVTVERGDTGAGVADAAAVNRVTFAPGASKQSIKLDENDETFGGGIGTELDFFYASTTEVVVTGTILVNVASTAIDALPATTFTATGY